MISVLSILTEHNCHPISPVVIHLMLYSCHSTRSYNVILEIYSNQINQIIFILKFQNTCLVIYVQVNIKEMRKGQPNNNTVILGRYSCHSTRGYNVILEQTKDLGFSFFSKVRWKTHIV